MFLKTNQGKGELKMFKFQPGDNVIVKEQQAFGIIYKPKFVVDAIERRSIFVRAEDSDESYVFDADSYSLEQEDKTFFILTNYQECENEFQVAGGFNE